MVENDWEGLRAWVVQGQVCLVEVAAVQGSAPRACGAWMAVSAQGVMGTIGGGHLEWEATRLAQQWLAQGLHGVPRSHRLALGPSLGQCCGGVVELRLSAVDAAQLDATRERLQPQRMPVALFGAGHVGHALVHALQPLPFSVHWVDSRDAMFPAAPLPHVCCEHSEPVQDAVRDLPAQSLVLVMSFSHAEDLDIVCACLRRQRERGDLPFIGLIGSATKWAVFQKRLAERGFAESDIAQITCPIGLPGIPGKEPEVIAIAVAAQLLQLRAQQLAVS
ncbi:xanthine dehydrogenase accessory protein XdhC [Comamonas kerstersii]|uniref:xanthine dehydrogenase accessory protein XdhC n=1 Tax=Comamonas kerstersii TaxID=225992 RepID=UPI003A8E33EE